MELLIGIATSIVATTVEYTVKPIARQLGYLFCYKSNIDNLKLQIRELGYARDRMQHLIEEARRNGEEIEADVENWLSDVDRIKEESENFLQSEDHAKTRCASNGPFPNLVSRHELSRKAKKMVQVVMSEILKAEKFDKVSYYPCIQNSIANRGYEVFESRVQTLRGIMAALKEINVKMIGMYGMGGIGKTVLAKEVARLATEEKLFDKVAIATVSQTPDVISIQQEIAEQVGLEKFSEIKSKLVRADRLRHRLSQETNILVIMDDVWDELNLSAIGIEFAVNQKGCKILLTSRSLNVLQDSMGAERNIEIKVLSDSEAIDLFKKNVGSSSENAELQHLAKDIVKECAGLPIAIATVAHALKNKRLSIWEDALLRLKRSIPANIDGMDQKVYSSIRLSYDFLQGDEEAKSLLLLCSLHTEDAVIEVEELMIYGVGWGLFREVYTLEEARNRVDSLINKLRGRCLLLDGYIDATVKMHDVIRDVMLSIAYEDRRMHNIGHIEKIDQELSIKKRLADSTAISLLVGRDINKLPETLECPRLELLFMFGRSQTYLQIPEQYFEEKKDLKVLRLDKVDVGLLPASFCLLQSLQALCLHSCMGNITLIGELKSLKILDLSWSDFEELPKHVGQLSHLQLLNLEGCQYLKVIHPGVISSLISLEELNMRHVRLKWEDDVVNGERSNASLSELKNLPQLTTLRLSIENTDILPKALFSEKLKRFELFLGETSYDPFRVRSKLLNANSLHLRLSKSNQLGDYGVEMIIKRTEFLYLYGFEGVNNIVPDLDEDGFCQLKRFWFESNYEIQYVVDYISKEPIQSCSAFQNLERLCLVKLMNLERIYNGKLTTGSFGKLRFITVRNCDKLHNLFSSSIARQLEEIKVIECKMVKEIVTHGTEEDTRNAIDTIEFPQLRSLTLEDLPEFVQFFQSDIVMNNTSSSDSPVPLFSKQVAFPGLTALTLSSMRFKDLCSNQLPTIFSLQNLTSLSVQNCHSLKHLLPFAAATSLVHLVTLRVKGCGNMEEVLITEEQVEERLKKTSFPKLKGLFLRCLPKLEQFCTGDSIEFPTLSLLFIEKCPQLRTFLMDSTSKETKTMVKLQSLFSEKVMFPNLETLAMDGREVMNDIWHRPSSTVPFCTLKELRLTYDDEKSVVFSFKFIQRFQNLEKLSLRGFSVEQICQQQEIDASVESGRPLPRLRQLELWDLSNLRHLFENLDNVKPCKAFHTLEALDLTNCQRLKRLVPFLEAFKNLKDLRIARCPKIVNLLASSTAKSLVQLTRMIVEECQEMREIVANKEGEIEDEIVFSRLRILALHDLPNLESFYSGNTTMRFPLLDKLILSQCPDMRSFSHGITTAEKLDRITAGIVHVGIWRRMGIEWYMDSIEYDGIPAKQMWEGDANSTVRKIWEEIQLSSNSEMNVQKSGEEAADP